MSVISFDPDPLYHITAWSLTFHIMAGYPVTPAIIMTGHPDPLPGSRGPFTNRFPVARNIFGLRWIPPRLWRWVISCGRWIISTGMGMVDD
jgi:hypothetical protein